MGKQHWIITAMILFSLMEQVFTQVETKKLLTLDQIFASSDFQQEGFGPYQWLGEGEFYTVVEQDSHDNPVLVMYDSKTEERSILLTASDLTPEGHQQPVLIDDYQWSADHKKVLIFTNSRRVWRTNTRGDYWVLDMEDKTLRKIGSDLPPSSLMFAKFAPDGNSVAYVSEHNLFLENLDNGRYQALTTDGNEHVINGTFDWAYEEEFFCKDGFRWSPDGNSIAFWQIDAKDIGDYHMLNTTDSIYPFTIPVQYPKVGHVPSSARLGIFDLTSGEIKWLDELGDPRENYLPRIQWLGASNDLLITQLNRKQNKLTLYVYLGADDILHKLYEEESSSWVDILHFDITSAWEMQDLITINDGTHFIWVSEEDGWRHLYEIAADGSSQRLLTPGAFDVASLKGFDEENGIIYMMASPENATERYLYSLQLNDLRMQRLTPDKYPGVNNYDVSPNGKYAVHTYATDMAPQKGFLVGLPDHTVFSGLYDNQSFVEHWEELATPAVEYFQVTTDDQVTLDGKMIKPHNFNPAKKYPVLFYVYGEPAGQTATARMGNLWHYLMAQKGYIVITMDNRGTPTLKGRDWRKAIYRKVGVINARDQAMAAKEVMKWDFVDAERIGVWGWSGGGAMTLNLMFKYPNIYKTGIAIAAVTNQLFYDNIYQERYMGLPQENHGDFIEGSPTTHASGLQGKLLYIHGTADDNVHYQNAEYLINELIRQNKVFDLMIYPNRSHGIYEGENTSRHLHQLMTNYLLTNLPPGARD